MKIPFFFFLNKNCNFSLKKNRKKKDHFYEEKCNFYFIKNINKKRTKKYINALDTFFIFYFVFKNKNKKAKVGPLTFSFRYVMYFTSSIIFYLL